MLAIGSLRRQLTALKPGSSRTADEAHQLEPCLLCGVHYIDQHTVVCLSEIARQRPFGSGVGHPKADLDFGLYGLKIELGRVSEVEERKPDDGSRRRWHGCMFLTNFALQAPAACGDRLGSSVDLTLAKP